MGTVLGIDEAGKGPVIGPLIIAGVLINKEDEKKLRDIEVKDSKLLTQKQREILFDKIIEIAKSTRIIIIEPEEIDKTILRDDTSNLNWLEAKKSAEIINEFNPETAILDSPHPIPQKYADYIKNLLTKDVELISEHKADVNYPVCSAASILAKVTREREMDKIKAKYGETGPGYPSNSITQEFVKNNWDKHPEIFRKSWKTYQNVANTKNQKKISNF
jgi:ribonuclease HII